MGYVIAGILVLLIVAGFITYLVMNSMKKGSSAAGAGQPGIGRDETPLGDTTEHAGRQTAGGETAEDAERNAGLDPAASPGRPEDRQLGDAGAARTAQPESERLADRPR